MREVIYYVATSLDGFIARADGSLDGFTWGDEFGAHLLEKYPETLPPPLRGGDPTRSDNQCFDSVLMGRKTYEVGLQEGINSPYPTLDQIVFSRTLDTASDSPIQLVRGGAANTVRALKKEAGKAIWLCGGGELGGLLFGEKLIDRLILKVNPVLFGTGVPLLNAPMDQANLVLQDHHAFQSGHMILHYRVNR
ncbi:MAG: dihydrofolate reductase family protein [Lysobacterales bacterium]